MSDIGSWLQLHGLEKYAETLIENDVGLDMVSEITDEDLKEFGVSYGDRKRFLKAVRNQGTADGIDVPPPPSTTRHRAEPERRQLTVMFADLVGSTELARSLDPEDLGELNRLFQDAAASAIPRYEGYIARYMGDGFLAYFGYPQAHEDDAERAVRAGIELLASVKALNAQIELSVRVGIATGPVVVGDLIGEGAAQESAVVGETPNLAARLQAFARPGTVLVSEATRSLLGSHIELSERSADLKGFPRGLACFEVRNVRGLGDGDGFPVSALAGREEELGLLSRRWRRAAVSDGQVVLLCGEPGVGKSQLIRSLREQIAEPNAVEASYFCSPYHSQSALHPVIEQLNRFFHFETTDSDADRFRRIEVNVHEMGLGSTDVAPYLASILSIHSDADLAVADPNEFRQRTVSAVTDWLVALSGDAPLLLVVEDLHWVDPTTLELLGEVVERVRQRPILALFSYRPEFSPPWATAPHFTVLTLNNLAEAECREIVQSIDRGGVLTESVVSEIVERADGVPLFVEELTKSVIESHVAVRPASASDPLPGGSLPPRIPGSLQDSLVARLDRLGRAKEIAQLGAVVGRQFSRDLLLAVSDLPEESVDGALAELCESGLTYRRGSSGGILYEFKHALIRDAAYETLLHARRREYHGRVAEALSATAHVGSDLARHWSEAGRNVEAAHAYTDAGETALSRGSPHEAEQLFRLGIESHSFWDAEISADQRLEFRLQHGLALATMQTHGFAAPDLGPASIRAIELADEAGDTDAVLELMDMHLSFTFGTSQSWSTFDELCDRFLPRAKHSNDLRHVAQAHALEARAAQSGRRGGLATVKREAECVIALRNEHPTSEAELASTLAEAYRVLGGANGQLGLMDQELEALNKGLAIAVRHELSYREQMLLFWLANSHIRRWEYSHVTDIGARGYDLALQRGNRAFAINFRGYWGEGLCGSGNLAEGLPRLQKAIDDALESRVSQPEIARLQISLVRAHLQAGDITRAKRVLESATEFYDRVIMRRTPHLMLVEAEVAAAMERYDATSHDAESAYRAVLEVAGANQRYWILPASIGLAGVLVSKGQKQAAKEQLSTAFASFTEGRKTPIMQCIRSLLEEV